MKKIRILRIIAAMLNFLLESAALFMLYWLCQTECFKTDKLNIFVIGHHSLTSTAILPDFAYMFLLCCLDRLGGDPMSIAYGFFMGVILIIATCLFLSSLLMGCKDVFLTVVIGSSLTGASALIHIIIAFIGKKKLSDVEKTWPIRRGR